MSNETTESSFFEQTANSGLETFASRPTPSAGNDVTEDAEWLREWAAHQGMVHHRERLERIANRLSAARPLGDDATVERIRAVSRELNAHGDKDDAAAIDELLARLAALSTASTREKSHG